MKGWITILVFVLSGMVASAQGEPVFKLVRTYPLEVADAVVDHLDNLYVITAQEQLKKYNANGDSVAVYNGVRRFGKLNAVDVSNPMRLLLFYKDFSSVVILDRLLAVRATIDLRQHNILQASAIGASYDNKIWVFDSYENKLKKLDEQGGVLQETADFRVLFEQPIVPQQILDRDGLVYLYDTTKGLFVFDYYGAFKRKLPVSKWRSIVVSGKDVLGVYANGISSFSTATFLERKYSFPGNFLPYYRYGLSQGRLVVMGRDFVSVFGY